MGSQLLRFMASSLVVRTWLSMIEALVISVLGSRSGAVQCRPSHGCRLARFIILIVEEEGVVRQLMDERPAVVAACP